MRKPVFLLGCLAVLAAALLAGLFGAADDARAITVQQVIITVDTASDSPSSPSCATGHAARTCSLREAIMVGDATSAVRAVIKFNIMLAGPNTISTASQLPDITHTTTIDGTTQPTSAACGSASTPPCITLQGPGFNGSQNGLVLNNGVQNVTIRGLNIVAYSSGILALNASNVTIAGNSIGTADGTSATANSYGVDVRVPSTGVTIGGTTAGDRNIISGNYHAGVEVDADGNSVVGNYIGTSLAGTAALPNSFSDLEISGSNDIIGGTQPGAGNVISGYSHGTGLTINGGGSNQVLGNLIGTDVTGLKKLGNGIGIVAYNSTGGNIIGGTTAAARNVISGNGGGVDLYVGGIQFMGNYVGTDATGNAALGNAGSGISVTDGASGVTIGGTDPGARNVIQNNGGDGVYIDGASTLGNSVSANSIDNNGGLGIELHNGGNNGQVAPVLASAVTTGSTEVIGALTTTANSQFNIEFFASPACDPSGTGEGRDYLGADTVTTNAGGVATIDATIPGNLGGQVVTATATDPNGDTSQFSNCVTATGPTATPSPTPSPTPTPSPSPTPSPTPTPTTSGSATPSATPSGLKGDANCDGKVDATDALDTLSQVGGVPPGAACAGRADVNCNGQVDANDALRILDYYAGVPLPQPSGCAAIGA